MANDFRRMWTKKEIESNSVVDLPDIPSVVDANSPDIIMVQGKLYYRKEVTADDVTDLTGTKWHFNETLSITSYNKWNINFNGYIKTPSYMSNRVYTSFTGLLTNIEVQSGNQTTVNFLVGENQMGTGGIYADGWNAAFEVDRNIEVIGGQDVENADLIAFLQTNATLLTTIHTYVEVGAYEELVKVIPTDVSIIEDEGKLELMLEHDGEVLAVNDTPNQFLQRRLDKPSAEWDSETSEIDLSTWFNAQEINQWQYINIQISGTSYMCIINSLVKPSNLILMYAMPIGVTLVNDGGTYYILAAIQINNTNNVVTLVKGDGSEVEIDILDIKNVQLF